MPYKLKKEFENTEIGFNNSGAPLGQRNDLHLLIKDAKAANHKMILDMFEEVPSDEELLKEQGDQFEAKQKQKQLDSK